MSTVRAVPAAGEMPRLRSLVRVVQTDAHEGPTYVPDEDALYFTSLPRPRVDVKRLQLHGDDLERETRDVTVVRADASGANGMAPGPDGRLVVCEQGSLERAARIALVDRATGAAETLVEEWGGRPLNSPNDVVVKGDGTIWFTDPAYGFLQGFRPEPQLGDFVYRHDPRTGRTSVVTDGFDKPNGLAFSSDERVLYVGDSGANQAPGSFHPPRPHRVEAFDVLGGRRLAGRRLLAVIAPGCPDGIKVDGAGRVYVSSLSGVQVFDPAGEPLGEIPVAGAVNFAWGGRDGDVLFITADTAIWAAVLDHPHRLEEA